MENAFDKIEELKSSDPGFFNIQFPVDSGEEIQKPVDIPVLDDIDEKPATEAPENETTVVVVEPKTEYTEYSDFSLLALQEVESGNWNIGEEDIPKDLDAIAFLELNRAQREMEIEKAKSALLDEAGEYAQYISHLLNGGSRETVADLLDLKQITELDTDIEENQKNILTQYYTLKGLEKTEIEDTIETILDKGRGKTRADEAVDSIKKYHDQILENENKRQEQAKASQKQAYETYVKQVTDAVSKGTLGGVKLDKAKQTKIIDALFKPTETVERVNPQTGQKEKQRVTKSAVLFNEVNQNPEKLALLTLWLLEGGDLSAYEEDIKIKQDNRLVDVLKGRKTTVVKAKSGFDDLKASYEYKLKS